MSYNNGKSQDIGIINDCESAIKDFSEGNLYLEKLLLECYNLGIKTNACCAGHKEKESLPYISFTYAENKNAMHYIISKLKDTNIEFGYIDKNSFYMMFDSYASDCFKILIDILNSFNINKNYFEELPQDLKLYFEIIDVINKLDLSKSKDYLQFVTTKENDMYSYNLLTSNNDINAIAFNCGFYIKGEDENQYLAIENENRKYFDRYLLKMVGSLNENENHKESRYI